MINAGICIHLLATKEMAESIVALCQVNTTAYYEMLILVQLFLSYGQLVSVGP